MKKKSFSKKCPMNKNKIAFLKSKKKTDNKKCEKVKINPISEKRKKELKSIFEEITSEYDKVFEALAKL